MIPKLTATRTRGDWIGQVAKNKHGPREIAPPFDLYDEAGNLIAFARRGFFTANEILYLHAKTPGLPYTKARRTNGMLSRSCVFGFMPRDALRHDYCRVSALARRQPQLGLFLEKMGRKLSEELRTTHPEQWEKQRKLIGKISATWRMPGTIYTSGIINLNNLLVYHRDLGNFPDSWNAMVYLRKAMSGGDLVIPEYGLLVRVGDGDTIWMDAAENPHGVTTMIPKRTDSYRISLVWYALRSMVHCGTPEEELIHIQQSKTGAARQKHSRNAEALREKIMKSAKKKP